MKQGEAAPRNPLQGNLADHLFYLVFDILTLLVELFLFDKLAANWDPLWIHTYFWVFLLFCVGIFLKSHDQEYLRGIDIFGNKYQIISIISVYFFGLALGGFALFSFVANFFKDMPPIFIAIPAAFIFVFGYPVLFGVISKTKNKSPKKLPVIVNFLFRIISYSAIFLMNTYMLSFVYFQLEKLRSESAFPLWTYPIVIVVTALLIILFYLPARIHLFFQTPDKKGNYISFIITCAGLAVFAVTGLYFRF
ncbi:MAG: hypothetical protein JXJ04_00170 [Spirochaetales bacterium]|nr:hypothetical protein [Spirochaetales bacterium]